MDLRQIIEYLLQTQNRRLIEPELNPGERNFNRTPGNPPVQLQEDGWLRSLIPYETGEGGPPGRYNGDHQVQRLDQILSGTRPGWMNHQNKLNNQMEVDLSNGAQSPAELNNFLMDVLRFRAKDMKRTKGGML